MISACSEISNFNKPPEFRHTRAKSASHRLVSPHFADRLPFVSSPPRLMTRRNLGSRQWQKNKTPFFIVEFEEVWNCDRAELIDEMIAPNAIAHGLEDPDDT